MCDEFTHRSKAPGLENLSEKCPTLRYCQLLEGHLEHTHTYIPNLFSIHMHTIGKHKKQESKGNNTVRKLYIGMACRYWNGLFYSPGL